MTTILPGYSATSNTSAATSFIDLATYSDLDSFLYGSCDAVTYFVKSVQKSNWFSQIPIALRMQGTVNFGQRNTSAAVNRSADYVLNVWFNVQIPVITLGIPDPVTGLVPTLFQDATVRWTRNLMHNLFDLISISFNELILQQFDSYWLDFNYQFRTVAEKRIGYKNMIGDVASLTTPVLIGQPLGTGDFRSCPFPFWFAEDHGVALPIAALPFNDVKINFNFRNLEDLVVVYPGTAAVGSISGPFTGRAATVSDVYVWGTSSTPTLQNSNTFVHYVTVHNDERVAMGDAPRDMLIFQVQEAQLQAFKDVSSPTSFDLRLSHAITLYFFAARNTTIRGDGSNYTTVAYGTGLSGPGVDPIAHSQLVYENTPRVDMNADYYSLVNPWYYFPAIPDQTGYHSWSYSLEAFLYNPKGSTNYSKLANVSIIQTMSQGAINAASTTAPVDSNGVAITYPNASGVLVNLPQTYQHVFLAYNMNIARVANGSIGAPVL